ncbi:hypothetical protein MLD38_017657 [Melastoma candidum]|uniref:Uncharacterized protein n=1 Tax=Melastoma candidum TaxID=119954 RepID=A0ACB9QRA6_9MYRT|nr:hypothetical protein MLD38_017657 [Melastoma candidum]
MTVRIIVITISFPTKAGDSDFSDQLKPVEALEGVHLRRRRSSLFPALVILSLQFIVRNQETQWKWKVVARSEPK